jgi:hypothetical protein
MATPKLWRGVILDGKKSKITGYKKMFYLPVSATPNNDIKYLWYNDLPPDIRRIFYSIDYENYYKLWEKLGVNSNNLTYLTRLEKIMNSSR